jgi:hypothetical protein
MFALLIREDRWEILADLLEQDLYVSRTRYQEASMVSYEELSRYVGWLDHRKRRLNLQQISVHADILRSRRSDGPLGEILPLEQFIGADYFLFLRSSFMNTNEWQAHWWNARSVLYIAQVPEYLLRATSKKYAQKLLRPLQVGSIEELRKQYREKARQITKLYKSLRHPPFIDPEKLASSS